MPRIINTIWFKFTCPWIKSILRVTDCTTCYLKHTYMEEFDFFKKLHSPHWELWKNYESRLYWRLSFTIFTMYWRRLYLLCQNISKIHVCKLCIRDLSFSFCPTSLKFKMLHFCRRITPYRKYRNSIDISSTGNYEISNSWQYYSFSHSEF